MIYKIFYPKSTSFVLIKFSITENITGSRSMKIWKVQTMFHVIKICVSQFSMKIKINWHSTGILEIDKITINKLTAPVSSIWDDILPLSILKRKFIHKLTLILTHSNLTLPLMLTNPNLTQTYFVTSVICHKYTRFVNLSQSNTVTNVTDVTGYNWKEVKVWTHFWPYTVCNWRVNEILINNSYLVKNESGIHIRVCLDVENLHWINPYMYKG